MRARVDLRLFVLAAFVVIGLGWAAACRDRNPHGVLKPPAGAPEWEERFASAFNDDYTREPINLSGRAPNDVLDQRLFADRLGHAHIVALVVVDQVWSRGRYQGQQDQYLEIVIEEVLIGELPRKVTEEQLLHVSGQDPLPGSLQNQRMLLFVRWAPQSHRGYHHHLMPAADDTVAFIAAMVEHARKEGVLDGRGHDRRRRRGKGEEPVPDEGLLD